MGGRLRRRRPSTIASPDPREIFLGCAKSLLDIIERCDEECVKSKKHDFDYEWVSATVSFDPSVFFLALCDGYLLLFDTVCRWDAFRKTYRISYRARGTFSIRYLHKFWSWVESSPSGFVRVFVARYTSDPVLRLGWLRELGRSQY